MARVFDRNIFIMLLSVMVGVIIITFFVADIMARTQEGEKYQIEIASIESQNVNFTTRLLSSLSYLDKSRESRSTGNYHFDLAYIWYISTLSVNDNISFDTYKTRSIDNCTSAIDIYELAYDNFGVAENMFTATIDYSGDFNNLVKLYVELSESGANLCQLRINASRYVMYLCENISFVGESVFIDPNATGLQELLNETIEEYQTELANYDELGDSIEKEYNIVGFSEIREEY